MANFILNGTVEKDSFKFSAGKEPATMYGKLEVTVEKEPHKKILAEDINVTDLNRVSLLVLKTKDEKYDVDIKYRVNPDGEEAKLNVTKILWLSLENKKPFSSIVGDTKIKEIELWLEKDQDAEQAIVEIMVLRRMPSLEGEEKGRSKSQST